MRLFLIIAFKPFPLINPFTISSWRCRNYAGKFMAHVLSNKFNGIAVETTDLQYPCYVGLSFNGSKNISNQGFFTWRINIERWKTRSFIYKRISWNKYDCFLFILIVINAIELKVTVTKVRLFGNRYTPSMTSSFSKMLVKS